MPSRFNCNLALRSLVAVLQPFLVLASSNPYANLQAPTSDNATVACKSIQVSLGSSKVETSTGPDYNQTINSPRNLFNTEFHPTCIVFPRDSADVKVAMSLIFEFEVEYAVQAGGHSANIGWNAVDSGVLISFQFMDHVAYDPSRDTIIMQPGARWGQSVTELEHYGVAPVGGRVDDVGMGLLLGGGLSFLSPAHGFGADNFVELDVVLVNGTLVTSTATNEYSDLFRALKGGANRFGIVTRYEVQAIYTGHADEKTWFGGLITYPESSFEALAKAISHFIENNNDPNAVHLSGVGFLSVENPGDPAMLGTSWLFYNGTELPQSVFGEFLSIPSISRNLTALSYRDVAFYIQGEGVNTTGHGLLWGASALIGGENTDDLYLETLKYWKNFSNTFSSEFTISSLAFTPVPLSQIIYGRERGGNAIDPPLVGYNAVLFGVIPPAGVLKISDAMEEGRHLLLEQLPASHGFPLYVNECDSKQEVFATYGSYEFLKRTYAKYDPSRFNVKHTRGPLGL